jgi:hypothetical protein
VAADDLTTLETFKEYAQIEEDDTAADAVINRLITWSSSLIRSHLQRAITIPQLIASRTIYFEGESTMLMEDRVEDITEVLAPIGYYVEGEIYSDDEVVVEFQYEQSHSFTRLILPTKVVGPVYVTGTWGWDTVPTDLEYACTLQVDDWFRGNVQAVWNPPDEGETKRKEISGALSDHVKEILEPWVFRTRVI